MSLPSGPGSIEGLGESFEPKLNTGTSSYSVPLVVPPGRAGLAPSLALVYNSGNGNGPSGLGWKLSFPNIQRQTDKGLPFYTLWPNGDTKDNDNDRAIDEYDEFDTLIYSGGEELVPVSSSIWRVENEGQFVRVEKLATGWEVRQPDGTIMLLGTDASSQVVDSGRVFRWEIRQIVDLNGNTIDFEYEKFGGGTLPYLTRIIYNHTGSGSGMTIEFNYELRPDIITDYRPRFELKTAYRCTSIDMFADGIAVRSYAMGYEPVSDMQPLSLLASVTQYGRDGISALPPSSFSYVGFDGSNAQAKIMSGAPTVSLDDGDIDLFDINGDSLPDILNTNTQPHLYYLNQGPDGNGDVQWGGQSFMGNSISRFLGAPATRLSDINGDGRAELMDVSATQISFFSVQPDFTWSSATTLSNAGFSFDDPDQKLVDVDHDKRIDVMETAGSAIVVWLSLSDTSWSNPVTKASPNPILQLSNPNTRLADMNGDRLLDLVYVQSGTTYYYPSMGLGDFGAQVQFNNPPPLLTDLSRVLLMDVNGDGRADIVYLGTTLMVWLNLGLDTADHATAEFAPSFSISSPFLSSFVTARQVDINANGSPDVLWNTTVLGSPNLAYVDFSPNEQPYQLKTITNGIGRTTTVTYKSSVADMVTAKATASPWSIVSPTPVSVIAAVDTSDGLQTYRAEYNYRDAYYDSADKEFRGFAGATQLDLGDVTIPDLVTEFDFDTGEDDESLQGKMLARETRNAAGEVFFQEAHMWETRVLLSGVTGDAREITFPFKSTMLKNVIEKGNGNPVQLRSDYDYDDYGNQTRLLEYGRMDSGWDDERLTISTFTAGDPSGLAAWIINKPVEQIVSDENSVWASAKRHYYDQNAALGAIAKGNLTRVQEWVSGNAWINSMRSHYDAFGNVIEFRDGAFGTAPGHKREIVYDPIYHTFPIEEHIDTGETILSMYASYDTAFGVMTRSTDFNGYDTHYDHDAFGRLIKVTEPYDSQPTVEYKYVLNADVDSGKHVNWVDTYMRESANGGTIDSREFFDGLGRSIMTRSEGGNEGQIVVSDVNIYNARQLVEKNICHTLIQGH